MKIASETAAKSSASNDSTRATLRAVDIRSRKERTGGRLRRMSRSEGSRRAVTSEMTDGGGGGLASPGRALEAGGAEVRE